MHLQNLCDLEILDLGNDIPYRIHRLMWLNGLPSREEQPSPSLAPMVAS